MATPTTSLLPSGYLSTAGNQIVSSSGLPVRIDSIGWFGTDGSAGQELVGLDQASYTNILNSVKADGFNAIRLPWSDVNLTAQPVSGAINYGLNPGLKGLNTLQIFQQIVNYCGQIGLKVIFDHHTNEGGAGGYGGQQGNGLWFDSGPGSNGTDGNGNTGTVTAAKFQQDWLTIAKTFAGNSTVIGFDLDNEPLVSGNNTGGSPVNWSQGGPTDIRAMYQQVGNAIQAVDPGALIIAEGPQEWGGTLLNGKSGIAPDGDLTKAASNPVVLTAPNKIVYSVHEYPSNIGGEPHDSGRLYIQQMNQDWGYLDSGHTAPVWIGEMGASMDGTNGALRDDRNWANTIVPYLNGGDGGQGGPTFSGNQQPVPTDWWAVGYLPGEDPDGYFASWSGNPIPPNTAQEAVVTQLAPKNSGAVLVQPATVTPDANASTIGASNGSVALSGNDLYLLTGSGAMLAVSGSGDQISTVPFANGITLDDRGHGTQITLNELNGPLTIVDFGADPAGHVTFTNTLPYDTVRQALAAAHPDGHGGTILGSVDFLGDTSLSAASISIART